MELYCVSYGISFCADHKIELAFEEVCFCDV